ncbi:MAG TPA: helix-turn-helix transcriptional regulator [Vicinamibacterales bacterium]|jgi:transcriptional regulator with XRE-family HTH domain|nr:helix-turn-helix transcriptional regulator [Vicinamibacterales bacterium]
MSMNVALKMKILESGNRQKAIAKAAKMLEPRLSRIVNGHDDPTPAERSAIAAALGLPEIELFPDATDATAGVLPAEEKRASKADRRRHSERRGTRADRRQTVPA